MAEVQKGVFGRLVRLGFYREMCFSFYLGLDKNGSGCVKKVSDNWRLIERKSTYNSKYYVTATLNICMAFLINESTVVLCKHHLIELSFIY